ncbi:unnamed protein product [Vicia faba]|uniref:Uncharacterized protein n=1 Tax=Vicia faba TaxID=3906 RepID=A0AAV0ZX42_VICFA|nr:unnamed protein product [Vicia faba]
MEEYMEKPSGEGESQSKRTSWRQQQRATERAVVRTKLDGAEEEATYSSKGRRIWIFLGSFSFQLFKVGSIFCFYKFCVVDFFVYDYGDAHNGGYNVVKKMMMVVGYCVNGCIGVVNGGEE